MPRLHMLKTFVVILPIIFGRTCHSLSSPVSSTSRGRELDALYGWLSTENRFSSGRPKYPLVELRSTSKSATQHGGGFQVSTVRDVMAGETLFRLGNNAMLSVGAAYADRDMGSKLRDLSVKAGPGFDIVALSGFVAAERIRRYHKRVGLGTAPESTGSLVPSEWGAFVRWLWSTNKEEYLKILNDEETDGLVRQGVQILVPLLDVTARRAWSAAPKSKPNGSMLDNEDFMFSWSRSDLETVATSAFAMVLNLQRPPPPFLLSGVGTLVPEPFVSDEAPDEWTTKGELTALIPLVDEILGGSVGEANAVLGSPSKESGNDCLWCIAARNLRAGEQIVALDPWDMASLQP